MSKKKQKKTSFKSAILLLLLMAILLITSTYAWFTANQTVTISSLQVNVQAVNGLQISADGTNWKSVLTNEDLENATATYATNTNQLPETMQPVSTAGTVVDGKLDMYYGQVIPGEEDQDGQFILTSLKQTDTQGQTGYYIAFDVFLRVDDTTQLYITPRSGVTFGDDAEDKGLQNSARIAFIDEGTTTVDAGATAMQALNEGTEAQIWEPNYEVHTPLAIANALNNYGLTITENNAQLDYYGIKAPISQGDNITIQQLTTPSEEFFAQVEPTYSTTSTFNTNEQFISLDPGVTKLRIYMWIEGQDVDCENGASGTDVKFDLQFTSNNA